MTDLTRGRPPRGILHCLERVPTYAYYRKNYTDAPIHIGLPLLCFFSPDGTPSQLII